MSGPSDHNFQLFLYKFAAEINTPKLNLRLLLIQHMLKHRL